ncbi:Stk1 family PASTA domain-containing Ser/Thr kinase [Macrococcus equipercicus]|uniref:non-specific serine/threonine protein kinase n=1 Tax=Macrococcus equipercicus TaxID=69967 RepID=A0ABQ6RBX8_9STAP|nr:Stk1 family PASTA domain-containing Ser/Thr kinase [Macrococcus equipercicus]KAA1042747.1 Stk1 family PASTA domain-containing Ser/Thr kinase [Macrococcus equipercicus]
MLGTIISERYKLIRYIGGGGMSNVYLAEDIILNRRAAVKIINIPPNDKERAVQRFEREVQNATSLSHPNIVQVIDVDEDDHHYYLIMEFIEGPTLSEYIKENGPLSVDEAILFTKQILRGIGHAHHHMIIHRDIKPQNILLTEDKELKITDFGIARALSETAMTQTNHVMGSVHYLPPEQAKGKAADESADIYSIGIVLYEMLTGHPPYEGDSPVSIAIKHIQEPLPDIRAVRSDVPQSLENVVIKATMKDKYSRYRSTEDMYTDLSTVLDAEREKEEPVKVADDKTMMIPVIDDKRKTVRPVTAAVTPEPRENTPAAKKRNPLLLLLMPLLLLLLALGGILWYMFLPKYSHVPVVSRHSLAEATALLEKENLRKGKVTYQYSEEDDGTVLTATPKAGTKLKEMAEVDLLVSKGLKKYKIQDYKGKKISAVKKTLEKAGFNKVAVKHVYESAESGTILAQSLNAGQQVIPGDTTVTFTVSKGLKKIKVADFTGQPFTAAKDELEALGFKVNVTGEHYSDTVNNGAIISQDHKDSSYTAGTVINFVVSKGSEPTTEEPTTEEPTTEEPTTEEPTTEEPATEEPTTEEPATEKPTAGYDVTYTETVIIPYQQVAQAGQPSAKKVEVYVEDKNNKQSRAVNSFNMNNDATVVIPMTIAPKGRATFIIKVDGKVFTSKTINYDDV